MRNRIFIVTCLLSCLFGCDSPDNWPSRSFDEAGWKAAPEDARYVFVNNLIETRKLNGLHRERIVQLLGKPSSAASDRVIYIIKTGGAGLDEVYILDIGFNKNTGVVDRVLVRGD